MGDTDDSDEPTYRVLEFYCGIGGLRYSLEKSGVKAIVVEAFDINEVANDVYEHNFGHRPSQGNVQGLSAKQLDKYRADAWLMSPPCQPYTRQGLQRDVDDPRAISFLKMIQLLPLMTSPPTHVLVENVVGFENSVTHSRLMAVLADAGLVTQEFILTPLQFGIPYSRPRYFCLAKASSQDFLCKEYNTQLLCHPGPLLQVIESSSEAPALPHDKHSDTSGDSHFENETAAGSNGEDFSSPARLRRNEPYLDPAVQCWSVRDYLELNPPMLGEYSVDVSSPSCSSGGFAPENGTGMQRRGQHSCSSVEKKANESEEGSAQGIYNDESRTEDPWEVYKVPVSVVDRWVDAYDIVTPLSTRCCCFTKSYTRYAKGAGSFLATNYPHAEKSESHDSLATHVATLRLEGHSLSSLGLRYFTPREVANLHSFPERFRFPPHVRLKQRYALLGNSLSVEVVSSLIKYLFWLSKPGVPLVAP